MKNVKEYKIELEKQKIKNDNLVKNVWELASEGARLEEIIDKKDEELKELQIRHEALLNEYEKTLKELEFFKRW